MEATNPYPEQETKKKKKGSKRDPEEVEEEEKEDEGYASLTSDSDDDGDDYDDDDEEEGRHGLDEDDSQEDDDIPWFKKPIIIGGIAVGIVVLTLIVYFGFIKKDAPVAAPTAQPVEEALDQTGVMKGDLYKMGIGKDAVDEKKIYEQGSIESKDFRKDFVNTDSPENFALPITIVAVNDSVSYTKHRTVTDDGMDMYWADAEYKSKKTRFTLPYYIWQTLAPQGVMDVIAEVVTDAEGKTFVTSITAVPPTEDEEGE